MGTALKSKHNPRDHGQPISAEELALSEFVPGFKYEVIEGRLYVSYEPAMPEDWVAGWLHRKLLLYSLEHPEIINYLSLTARVFVPTRRRGETIPEPDLAAYLLRSLPRFGVWIGVTTTPFSSWRSSPAMIPIRILSVM